MKRFIATMGIALMLMSTAFATQGVVVADKNTLRKGTVQTQSLLARVTVYWAGGGRGSDYYTRQHKSSTGMRLRTGHCAVDPRKIPYGSQVIFPDQTGLVAVDTGSAVRSRKAARRGGRTDYEKSAVVVDRFFETKGQALSWARRNPAFMTVRVVPPTYRPQPTVRPARLAPMIASNAPVVSNPTAETKPLVAAPKPGYRAL